MLSNPHLEQLPNPNHRAVQTADNSRHTQHVIPRILQDRPHAP
jgi:hypothetical protein